LVTGSRYGDVWFRTINADDVTGRGSGSGGCRQRSGPATDIEHVVTVFDARKLHQERSETGAPPTHE